ncbi:MAG: hypothetical protein GX143_00465 [Alcaligenaceae bacterium]|jgi:uncharacterized membrane protein|nr:hypothetical protein [Alcaligenaceae bacterium]
MKKSAINRQRGSIILPVVVSLLVGVLLLGGVQLGYYFFMKRELQNTADLAVLSGVQLLQDGASVEDGCNKAITAARANARQNFARHDELIDAQLSVVCGNWSESHAAPRHFAATVDADGFYNALYLSITYDALPFMPFSSEARIAVEAIAKKDFLPTAAFSVGPQLLRLNDGLLTNTLAAIGVNLDNTSVLDYKGLANVMITPAGLLEALGVEVPANLTVGDLQKLVSGEIGVKALVDVLETSIGVADGRGLLSVDQLNLLSLIKGGLAPLDLSLQLFSDATENGLFALIETPSEKINAALNTEVSLGSIVDLMLGVATQGNALALGGEDGKLIDLGILRVEAKLAVIEPPSIGIGGTGTTAYSSNIRLFARVCLDLNGACQSNAGGTNSSSLLGNLLGSLIQLKIDLPLVVELVNGKGTLGNMCHKTDEQGRKAAEIFVETSVGDICVGAFDLTANKTDPTYPFSGTMSCVDKLTANPSIANFNHPILSLKVLNTDLVSLKTSLPIKALSTEDSQNFFFHDPRTEPQNIAQNTKWMPASGNGLSVGTTVKGLVDAVLAALVGDSLVNSGELQTGIGRQVADKIWNDAKAVKGCSVSDRDCRKSILELANSNISSGLNGLKGFLGNVLDSTLGLVGDLLTLDLVGVLGNLGDLLGGVLGGVGELLAGDGCTHGGILGELFGQTGNEAGCKDLLAKSPALSGTTNGQPNALLVILGLVTNLLQGPLDALGSQLLNPLLNALGVNLGQVETTLISLNCNDAAKLVY